MSSVVYSTRSPAVFHAQMKSVSLLQMVYQSPPLHQHQKQMASYFKRIKEKWHLRSIKMKGRVPFIEVNLENLFLSSAHFW